MKEGDTDEHQTEKYSSAGRRWQYKATDESTWGEGSRMT